jgi:hypothetical protein
MEADNYSSWWEVNAIFDRQPALVPPPPRWIEHEHFEAHLIEMLPADRAAVIEAGQALAAALGAPFYANPPEVDGEFISWLQQRQSARLRELLDQAQHLLVLSGRGFSPVRSQGSIPHSELIASADARARHWTENVDDWQAIQRWRSIHAVSPGANPYRALVDLERRQIL